MPEKSYEDFGRLVRTLSRLLQGHAPGQIIIQLTDRCNATCPQCGMRVTEPFSRSTLPTDTVKRIIDSADPEYHEKARGLPGVIRGVEKALPIFHDHGIYPAANLGITRNIGGALTAHPEGLACSERDKLAMFGVNFRASLHRFYELVMNMGFTIVNTCYPMSVDSGTTDSAGLDAVYAATAADDVVRFSQAEKRKIFNILLQVIPLYRSRLRIFTPRASVYALRNHYKTGNGSDYHCRGGTDFFFIDAVHGDTFPCGYRGNDNLGKYWDLPNGKSLLGASCTLCDWECFRDPSELFGPLLQATSNPLALWRYFRRDPDFFHLWKEDMAYYRACDFFDGRRPPRTNALRRFANESKSDNCL